VRELRRAGWSKARALVGGWAAWRSEGLPVEPREVEV
jgi:3-mercaptopyruvate sulfurtransferase SseA